LKYFQLKLSHSPTLSTLLFFHRFWSYILVMTRYSMRKDGSIY